MGLDADGAGKGQVRIMERIHEWTMMQSGVRVIFELYRVNRDYLVAVTGGQVPHIGAVSLNGQTVAAPGHKEDVITSMMAEWIRTRLRQSADDQILPLPNICIIGGVHVDNITKEQIRAVVGMCEAAAERIAGYII